MGPIALHRDHVVPTERAVDFQPQTIPAAPATFRTVNRGMEPHAIDVESTE
jgi:hypothetical protein